MSTTKERLVRNVPIARVPKPGKPRWRTSLLDRVFGNDFFIAYARADGTLYAQRLKQALEQRGFRCFIDQDGFHAGDPLPAATARALKQSTHLLVVCTDGAFSSPHVLREVTGFTSRHGKIIPINIGNALARAPESELARKFLGDEIIWINDTPEALASGPSAEGIQGITLSFKGTRQETKRLRVFALLALVFAILSAFTGLAARSASRQASRAESAEAVKRVNRLTVEGRSQIESDPFAAATSLDSAVAVAVANGRAVFPATEVAARQWMSRRLRYVLRGHQNNVMGLAWSEYASGRFLATSGYDGVVRLWNTDTWLPTRDLTAGFPVTELRFSPEALVGDSFYLAAGGEKGQVLVWRLPEGQVQLSTAGTDSLGAGVRGLAWGSGSLFVLNSVHGVRRYPVYGYSRITTLRGPVSWACEHGGAPTMTASGYGSQIAFQCGSDTDRYSTRVVDPFDELPARARTMHGLEEMAQTRGVASDWTTLLRPNPSAQRREDRYDRLQTLVTASLFGVLYRQMEDGSSISIPTYQPNIRDISVQKRHVAVGGRDGMITFVDIGIGDEGEVPFPLIQTGRDLYKLAWHPDEPLLATTSVREQVVRVFSPDLQPYLPLDGFGGAIGEPLLVHDPSSQRMAVFSRVFEDVDVVATDSAATAEDADLGEWPLCSEFSGDEPPQTSAAAWSPDGRFIAAGSNRGTVTVWPITDRCAGPIRSPATGNRIFSLSWRPSGHELYVGTQSGRVFRWSFRDPAQPRWEPIAELQGMRSLTWAHRSDQAIAVSGDGRRAYLWDPANRRLEPLQLRPASGSSNAPAASRPDVNVFRVAWQPGDRQVALVDFRGGVSLYSVETQRIVWTRESANAPIFSLDWQPAGEYLALGRYDGTVLVISAEDGAAHADFRTPFPALSGVVWSRSRDEVFATGSQGGDDVIRIPFPRFESVRAELRKHIEWGRSIRPVGPPASASLGSPAPARSRPGAR